MLEGRKIDRLRAFDEDRSDSIFFHVFGGDGKFGIDNDGVLYLAGELDREEKEYYELRVVVTNSEDEPSSPFGNQPSIAVNITVLDVNDNGPQFEQSLYRTAFHKNSLAGTELLSVRAIDPDGSSTEEPSEQNKIIYGIVGNVYRHGDKTRQADGYLTIGENDGLVKLAYSANHLVGGLFDAKIVTSDDSENQNHLAFSRIKAWIYDEEYVVSVKLLRKIQDIKNEEIIELIRELSDVSKYDTLLLRLDYTYIGGYPQESPLEARFLFIDSQNDTIIPAKVAISIVDENSVGAIKPLPQLFQAEAVIGKEKSSADRTSAAALLLCVFSLLSILILIIFGIIMCYHRAKFLREKADFEDRQIAIGSMNKSKRYKQPPPYIRQTIHNLREKPPNAESSAAYSVQEVNMVVTDNSETIKRVHYLVDADGS
ncbi:hypothetical protein AB6A40_007950 [Gnathostoma spinigerum]|uniref:Cadherin domain-containing protein n=1 Tax=Gnathostoma spinigerum TaxID=75299 RepID=A0ABD6EPN5_9BILA